MLKEIFDINKFNVFSDDENYYFFRALNMADNNDIETGIILDSNGQVEKIRTNRERYDGVPKYSEDDVISLEQITDHIKMHQLKETNCISLTSNANTALTYGRGYYKDKYVMIKVPKTELGKSTYEAGLYMLEQINNVLNNYMGNDVILKKYFEKIDGCSNNDELEKFKQNLIKNNIIKRESDNDELEDSDLFEKGYVDKITNSKNYISLNEEQNFEKNKMVLKIDLINKQILPKISNRLLIQTIGNAFSSLEMIHYGEISKEEIIELPKEITDVFGLIQQMPSDLEFIDEIKEILISKVEKIKFTGSFTYKDFNIEDSSLSIENLYKITDGKVSYGDAIDLYKKAFYLSKSKLRTKRSVQVLNKLLDNNPKYYNTLNYILRNGYGIEPEITTRLSKNLVSVSESVSIDINNNKSELVDYINSLDEKYLTYILDSPNNALEMLLPRFLEKKENVERKEWIADAIIDKLDLSRFNIKFNLREHQRDAIKKALINNDVEKIYFYLKRQNVNEKDIANVLFTNIIKNKNTIDLSDTFSLEELEYFIGYNRVKGTGLNLRKYQEPIVENINKKFQNRNFTSVILPTGAGKSYIALAEMYKFEKTLNELNKDNYAKILYLAPNDEILNQLKDIIRETYKPEVHLTDKDIDQDIKRIFPNLTLSTYQNLKDRTDNDNNIKEIFETKYDLIIFDELHRTGAREWKNHIDELIDNQDSNVKVLGITATPERDMDSRDMTEYWARKFRYSDEEILEHEHLSYNMDIIEAIKSGIVACPKVVNCIYNLKNEMDDLKFSIEEIKDDQLRAEKLLKYEKIRRTIDSAIGIEQVLNENIKQDSKYIVFLPITRKCEDEDGNTVYVDNDGNEVKQSIAHQIVNDYQILFHQYLFSDEYLKNNPNIKNLYNKIVSNANLTEEEIDYLNYEKDNIMLLSKFEMKYKQNDLISQNDLIANEIINYMNWEKISKQDLASELKDKMKNKIEDYSMLGSYGAKANKRILDKFNKPTESKIKLMFVMNKLNEGVHAKGISGIIWMRPMDQNSRILFLQQLGRCIKSLDEGQEIDENDIPMVIDLVNNSLKVKLNKNHSLEQDDLENILMVKDWIKSKNRMPSGKTNDKEEIFIAKTIIELQDRYTKYLNNLNLLKEDMKYEKTIVKIGCDIDIWDLKIEFDKKNRERLEKDKQDDLVGLLGIEAITRDFIELKEEIKKCNLRNFEFYFCLLNDLKSQGENINSVTTIGKVRIEKNGKLKIIKKIYKTIDGEKNWVNKDEYLDNNLINLGAWLKNNQDKFTEEQKQRLRDIGYVLAGEEEDIFETYFGYLVKLKEQGINPNIGVNDKLRINEDFSLTVIKKICKTINGKLEFVNRMEFLSKDLICAGSWLRSNQYKFTDEQKQRLRDIGYVLAGEEEDLFETYYGYLVKLKEQGINPNITGQDKLRINEDFSLTVIKKITKMVDGKQSCINRDEYFSEDLICVGAWLKNNQDKFTEEQKQRLRDIGYVLTGEEEDLFETYYGYLVKLKEQGDNTNLLYQHKIRKNNDGTLTVVKMISKMIDGKEVISNSDEYFSEDLICVGAWLKTNQDKFTEEQKQRLRDIGYVLTGEEKDLFETYYGYLVKLKEQGDNTNLVSSDRIRVKNDGTIEVVKEKKKRIGNKVELINKEEVYSNDLIRLGAWLKTNQDKFTEEQKQRLRDIGYVLLGEENDFDSYFSILIKLKEQGENINLARTDKIRVNADGSISIYKINVTSVNGKSQKNYDEGYFDEDLFRLGYWFISNQDKFTEEQKQRLRDIGYVLKEDKESEKDKFERNYNYLVKLKEQGDDTNLTSSTKLRLEENGSISVVKKVYKSINGKTIFINKDEYSKKELVSAGLYLFKNQDKFTEEQKQRLRDIGYVLNKNSKKKYEESDILFEGNSHMTKIISNIQEKRENNDGRKLY